MLRTFHRLISLLVTLSMALQTVLPVAAWTISENPKQPLPAPTVDEEPAPPVPQSQNTTSDLYLPLVTYNHTSSQPTEVIIEPGVGGELWSPDGKVQVLFSAEAVTETVTVRYEDVAPPQLPPGDLGVAGPAFRLTAWTENGAPATYFPQNVDIVPATETRPAYSDVNANVTIFLHYTPEDTVGLDLRTLFLYAQDDNGNWYRTPSATYQELGYIKATIEYLGRFTPMAEVTARQIHTPQNTVPFALDPDDNDASIYWPEYGETWYEGVLNYQLAEQVQQRFVDDQCDVNILITRDASQQTGFVDNGIRAQAAINYGSVLFTTLAFNTYLGQPWGSEGDGGMRVWRRAGDSDDNALADQLVARLPEYTGRPSTLWGNDAFYNEFASLPMVYAHSETLFMDHNYDGAVIHGDFNLIADAVYAALGTRLGEMGVTCGEDNQPPPLPAPPSQDVLQRLRDLGYQNMMTYGTKYDLIRMRNAMIYGVDPISFSTGNFIKQVRLFTLPGRGGLDFNFTLFYNAQDMRSDLFGHGWSFPYNARLQKYSDESVSVTLNDGRSLYYTWNGSSYEPPAGIYEELRATADGWEWETMDGTVLTFEETITGLGILTKWRDRQGNALHFTHDLSGQDAWEEGNPVPRPPLTEIMDDNGRTISVTSNDQGLITGLDLFDGRSVTFQYDAEFNLTHIRRDGVTEHRFAYDSRHRMTDLWDAENIHYLQNIYDDRDRVVEQIDASGAHAYLDYDPINNTTTFTDNLGNVEVYHYDELNRVTQVKDARDGDETYVYDEDYNLLAYTDANGNTTEYAYDDRGNLIQRIDPVDAHSSQYYTEDVSAWTYNERNLVTSYTNALGHTWEYEYDADGNLTRTLAPDGSETTAAYNAWGQPTAITDALDRVTEFVYDENGNLQETIYPDGTRSSSTYDDAGRETSYSDANGHTVQFEYDENDNITRILDPKLQPSQFFYDDNNLLVRSIDRRGGETLYQYNDDLKLVAERDAEHNWTYYGYDAMYNRDVITNALGFATHYTYDEAYNLASVTTPNGGVTRYEYDDKGNMTAVIDPNGHRTRFIYDAMNRVKFTIDAEGGRTEFCYNAEDQLIRIIDPRHAVTTYEYDAVGNLERMIDPYGEVTEYERDAAGNMIAAIDPLGYRTDMSYDPLDRLTAVMNPILPGGQRPTTQFAYDNVGNTITITNPMGIPTTFDYDENDNLFTISDALGGEVSYNYDAEDNPIAVTDQNNHTTETAYNLVGLPTVITDALGYTRTTTYDAVYNSVAQSDPMGRTTSYTYDEMGWLTAATDPLSHTTSYEYDLAGQAITVTDANAHSTGYRYDGVGRLISVQDALSGTTRYAYDIVGNLATITNAVGSVTQFEYNLLNQVEREINPLGDRWEYSYDELGRLTRRVDANWRATYYEYDSNGRLLSTRYGSLPPHTDPVTYTYDLNGNELMMCDGLGCTTHTYDVLDRPLTTTDWLSRTITRTYDAAGNLTALTYPNGRTVQYDYNANDWLTDVTIPGGYTSSYSHNPAGQVTQIQHPNNTIVSYTYDPVGRLTGIDNRQLGAPQPQSAYQYALDAVGNRVEVMETRAAFDGSAAPVELLHTYQYDALDRLVNAATTMPDSSTDYVFDAVGNRLSKTGTVLVADETTPELPVAPVPEQVAYTYNAADQMLTAGATSFAYDNNGNRIQETEVLTTGTTLLTAYDYDREDRLVQVTKEISETAGITVTMVATYTYDGYGRRALKEVSYPNAITATQVITYLYSGLDIIGAQIAASDVITESYYYLADSAVTGMKRPFALERLPNPDTTFTGDTYWYQTDGLDSVVSLVDAAGEVVSPYLYDEYGNHLTTSSELQLFVYTSQDYDPETGFSHYFARYYDSVYGLWLTSDRLLKHLRQAAHLYSYVGNNPLNNVDALGYLSLNEVGDWATAVLSLDYFFYTGQWLAYEYYGHFLFGNGSTKQVPQSIILSHKPSRNAYNNLLETLGKRAVAYIEGGKSSGLIQENVKRTNDDFGNAVGAYRLAAEYSFTLTYSGGLSGGWIWFSATINFHIRNDIDGADRPYDRYDFRGEEYSGFFGDPKQNALHASRRLAERGTATEFLMKAQWNQYIHQKLVYVKWEALETVPRNSIEHLEEQTQEIFSEGREK